MEIFLEDLITFAQGKITSENEEVSELQDNNDKTCSDKKTIKVDFKTDYYFSWLRAVVEYCTLDSSVTISFIINSFIVLLYLSNTQ